MSNETDLRRILSQNIKAIRQILHISQAKLAEYANISLSYLTDIECCRTWVSDKTLQNLARALNRESWELLVPGELLVPNGEQNRSPKTQKSGAAQRDQARHMADIITKKKESLRRAVSDTMEELIMEIAKGK